jgi:hypothetical protein
MQLSIAHPVPHQNVWLADIAKVWSSRLGEPHHLSIASAKMHIRSLHPHHGSHRGASGAFPQRASLTLGYHHASPVWPSAVTDL